MLTPGEIERFPIELEGKFSELEMSIMEDIINRIKINGNITSTADWQLVRLKQLGQSNKYIRKTLSIMLNKTDKDVSNLFKAASQQEYIRDKELYTKVSAEFIPYSKNFELQQFINSLSMQTSNTFGNITNSLGFATQSNGKVTVEELSTYYTKTLDKAMLDITSGAFSKEQVLKRVIKEMTDSGLRTIDYESGYSNRINVAARRAINTSIGQVTAKVNEINAGKLNTDYYEVSWHGTARPTHQIWQGRVYSYNELLSICGLGSVTGLVGANCRHSYHPFIKDISKRIYTDEQLDNMNAKENIKHEYNGKRYTSYEATQRMRQLETRMRSQRQQIKLNKDVELDTTAERARYRETMSEYSKFAKSMDLPQQRARIYEDGLGRL